MSGASFWAKGAHHVKAVSSPLPSETQVPTPAETPAQKKGLVFKGVTNGTTHSSTPTSIDKKTNWADSDDDEEFLAAITLKKNPRIIVLENTVTTKDAQIVELEAKMAIKDVRIEELETMVVKKDQHICELATSLQDKSSSLENVEKQLAVQTSHVEKLVAEVDEKDRRIAELETEVDAKGVLIHELEQESDSHTQVSSGDTDSRDVKSLEEEEASKDDPKDSSGDAGDDEEKALPSKESAGEEQPEQMSSQLEESTGGQSAQKPCQEISKAEDTTGLSFNTSDFPTFVTKETLKVVPPAPKPKTLSFPIDFSKYGKKSTQPASKQMGSKLGKDDGTSWGITSKQKRAKTDKVPVISPDADIRRMTHAERVEFANGPEVALMMGDVKLGSLTKYVLMQCSSIAFKYFSDNPNASSITFSAGSMAPEAAKIHMEWMDEMTYQGRVYSVTLNTDPKFDTKNLKICRAARVLGMHNTYVGHFTKQMCDRIRDENPSTEFMSLICELEFPGNDPIFDCLANNLVDRRLRDPTKTAEQFEALVAKFPNLKKKTDSIESRIGSKRRANRSRDASSTRSAGKNEGKKN